MVSTRVAASSKTFTFPRTQKYLNPYRGNPGHPLLSDAYFHFLLGLCCVCVCGGGFLHATIPPSWNPNPNTHLRRPWPSRLLSPGVEPGSPALTNLLGFAGFAPSHQAPPSHSSQRLLSGLHPYLLQLLFSALSPSYSPDLWLPPPSNVPNTLFRQTQLHLGHPPFPLPSLQD